jgi:hypothetical protein
MIYQHATRDRDQAIARALGGLAQQVWATTASVRHRPAAMGSSWLLWPVCGPSLSGEPLLIKETTGSGPLNWAYVLERAKGIEPS